MTALAPLESRHPRLGQSLWWLWVMSVCVCVVRTDTFVYIHPACGKALGLTGASVPGERARARGGAGRGATTPSVILGSHPQPHPVSRPRQPILACPHPSPGGMLSLPPPPGGQQNLHSSNRWHLRGNRRRLEGNRRRLEGNRRRLETKCY